MKEHIKINNNLDYNRINTKVSNLSINRSNISNLKLTDSVDRENYMFYKTTSINGFNAINKNNFPHTSKNKEGYKNLKFLKSKSILNNLSRTGSIVNQNIRFTNSLYNNSMINNNTNVSRDYLHRDKSNKTKLNNIENNQSSNRLEKLNSDSSIQSLKLNFNAKNSMISSFNTKNKNKDFSYNLFTKKRKQKLNESIKKEFLSSKENLLKFVKLSKDSHFIKMYERIKDVEANNNKQFDHNNNLISSNDINKPNSENNINNSNSKNANVSLSHLPQITESKEKDENKNTLGSSKKSFNISNLNVRKANRNRTLLSKNNLSTISKKYLKDDLDTYYSMMNSNSDHKANINSTDSVNIKTYTNNNNNSISPNNKEFNLSKNHNFAIFKSKNNIKNNEMLINDNLYNSNTNENKNWIQEESNLFGSNITDSNLINQNSNNKDEFKHERKNKISHTVKFNSILVNNDCDKINIINKGKSSIINPNTSNYSKYKNNTLINSNKNLDNIKISNFNQINSTNYTTATETFKAHTPHYSEESNLANTKTKDISFKKSKEFDKEFIKTITSSFNHNKKYGDDKNLNMAFNTTTDTDQNKNTLSSTYRDREVNSNLIIANINNIYENSSIPKDHINNEYDISFFGSLDHKTPVDSSNTQTYNLIINRTNRIKKNLNKEFNSPIKEENPSISLSKSQSNVNNKKTESFKSNSNSHNSHKNTNQSNNLNGSLLNSSNNVNNSSGNSPHKKSSKKKKSFFATRSSINNLQSISSSILNMYKRNTNFWGDDVIQKDKTEDSCNKTIIKHNNDTNSPLIPTLSESKSHLNINKKQMSHEDDNNIAVNSASTSGNINNNIINVSNLKQITRNKNNHRLTINYIKSNNLLSEIATEFNSKSKLNSSKNSISKSQNKLQQTSHQALQLNQSFRLNTSNDNKSNSKVLNLKPSATKLLSSRNFNSTSSNNVSSKKNIQIISNKKADNRKSIKINNTIGITEKLKAKQDKNIKNQSRMNDILFKTFFLTNQTKNIKQASYYTNQNMAKVENFHKAQYKIKDRNILEDDDSLNLATNLSSNLNLYMLNSISNKNNMGNSSPNEHDDIRGKLTKRLDNFSNQLKNVNEEYCDYSLPIGTERYFNYQNLTRTVQFNRIVKLNIGRSDFIKVRKIEDMDIIMKGIKKENMSKRDMQKTIDEFRIRKKALACPNNVKMKLKSKTVSKFNNYTGVFMGTT